MTVVELKTIQDAYQTASDTTKSVDTKPVAAETQSAAVDEAAVIDVKAAAEEHEYAVAVQELTEPVTDQPKSVEAEFDEVVDAVEAVKDESVDAKAVETKIIDVDEVDVEDVVQPESNDKEAVAASVETDVTVEKTIVSDDVQEQLFAEAVTTTEPTESGVVVAEVNSDVKAGIDSSDKVSADKEEAPNEGLTVHATNEEPANERISAETSDEITSVIEANANKAIAVEEAAENKSLDEAELVTHNMDLSVEVIVTDQTVEEVVAEAIAEAVADSGTDDKAFSTETRFSAEGDIERKVAEVIKDKAVPVDDEVEMDEAVVNEVEAAAAPPITEIEEAVVRGTETASTTETPEVFVEKAETEVTLSEDIGNVEVEAVENELATEKLEEIEQSVDGMPKEVLAVAAVENAAAIVKDSDNESAPAVVKSTPADDNPVAVNLGTSTIGEYEKTESLKSSDQFEVDTKPISAVTTLIGRFEHIAKENASEAGNSRTSSRNSSRVSSPLPSPPSSWSRGNAFETVAKSDNAIDNFEGPVREESNTENEDVLTEAEADQTEVEKTATAAVSVVESAAFEETPALREKATILSVTETVADEKAPAAEQSLVVEASAIEVEAEAADEKSDEIEDNIVAEVGVVEPKLIDESTEAEVQVEKTLAAEVEMVEGSAEPEAEDVDLETSTEEETSGIAEEAKAPALEATEAYRALEEVPVADMAEADVETSETHMTSAVYQPTEASILSVDGVEVDAVRHEAVTNVQEIAEDVAPSGTSFVDVDEAVATADFTTDEAVTTQIEEASSEFVSAMKETQALYNELQESQVEQKEVSQPMEMMSVRTDDGTLTDEATVVMALTSPVAMALTSPVTKTMERTPERNASPSPVIPYEHLTYEILGVTRANNVIMYHVYTINHATGEQAMSIPKRYSEFKVLDEQLRSLNGPSGRDLPVLPKPSVGTFLRGRRSQKTIEMREKAFGDLLHYVRDHDDLHQSTIFQQFIAH